MSLRPKLLPVALLASLLGTPPLVAAGQETVGSLIRQGYDRLEMGRTEAAVALFERADTLGGRDSFEAAFGLGIALRAQDGNATDEEALRAARRAHALAAKDDDRAAAAELVGLTLRDLAIHGGRYPRERHTAAAEAFLEALEHRPGSASLHLRAADALSRADPREFPDAPARARTHLDRARELGLPSRLQTPAERLACLLEDRSTAVAAGGDVSKPTAVHRPRPQHPGAEATGGAEGMVIVQAILDETGRVACARGLSGPRGGLVELALETVETWRFEPATVDGRPVPIYYNVTVDLRLPSDAPGR